MNRSTAEIVREYGDFPGVDGVHGVTYDGQHVWFAAGDKLIAFDLGLSIRTVEAYRAQLLVKLGVRSTAEAVRIAIAAGLVGH